MKLNFDDALFIMSLVMITVSIIMMVIKGKSPWIAIVDKGQTICCIRWILAAFAINSGFFIITDSISIYFMPLGDAMTIILCSVVPTTIFASIFLKEHFKLHKLVCVFLAITGVVLVINPTSLFHSDVEFTENNSSRKMTNMTSSVKINERNSKFYYIGVMSALTCMTTIAIFRILMTILLKKIVALKKLKKVK